MTITLNRKVMERKENKVTDWITPSCLARKLGVSVQTVYNRVKTGKYEAHTYERGKMNGILIKCDSIKL